MTLVARVRLLVEGRELRAGDLFDPPDDRTRALLLERGQAALAPELQESTPAPLSVPEPTSEEAPDVGKRSR